MNRLFAGGVKQRRGPEERAEGSEVVEALRKGATQVAAGRGVSGSSSRAVRVRRLVKVQTCNSCWGGSRAGARASGWAGRPRWVRISAVTNDEKTQATTRRLPPHLPHVKRSTDQRWFAGCERELQASGAEQTAAVCLRRFLPA